MLLGPSLFPLHFRWMHLTISSLACISLLQKIKAHPESLLSEELFAASKNSSIKPIFAPTRFWRIPRAPAQTCYHRDSRNIVQLAHKHPLPLSRNILEQSLS